VRVGSSPRRGLIQSRTGLWHEVPAPADIEIGIERDVTVRLERTTTNITPQAR